MKVVNSNIESEKQTKIIQNSIDSSLPSGDILKADHGMGNAGINTIFLSEKEEKHTAVMDGCESQHRTSVIEERVCPKMWKEVEVLTSRGKLTEETAAQPLAATWFKTRGKQFLWKTEHKDKQYILQVSPDADHTDKDIYLH